MRRRRGGSCPAIEAGAGKVGTTKQALKHSPDGTGIGKLGCLAWSNVKSSAIDSSTAKQMPIQGGRPRREPPGSMLGSTPSGLNLGRVCAVPIFREPVRFVTSCKVGPGLRTGTLATRQGSTALGCFGVYCRQWLAVVAAAAVCRLRADGTGTGSISGDTTRMASIAG